MSLKNLEMSGPSITKKEIQFVLDVMKNGWYGKKILTMWKNLKKNSLSIMEENMD